MKFETMNRMAVMVAALAMASAAFAQSDKPMGKTLYDRLGGIHKIAAVMDQQVEMLLKDEKLAMNKQAATALASLPKPALKFQLTAMVAQLMGGPQVFVGP